MIEAIKTKFLKKFIARISLSKAKISEKAIKTKLLRKIIATRVSGKAQILEKGYKIKASEENYSHPSLRQSVKPRKRL